jgi:hypothetical protein
MIAIAANEMRADAREPAHGDATHHRVLIYIAVSAKFDFAERTVRIDRGIVFEVAVKYRAVILDDRACSEAAPLYVTVFPDLNVTTIKSGIDHTRTETDSDVGVSALVLQQKDQTFQITKH